MLVFIQRAAKAAEILGRNQLDGEGWIAGVDAKINWKMFYRRIFRRARAEVFGRRRGPNRSGGFVSGRRNLD
jgi:hypothetical protein